MKEELRIADCGLRNQETSNDLQPSDLQETFPNSQSAIRNPQSAIRLVLPALICLAYFLTVAYLAAAHPYGTYTTETDFYHYYAPDAERIAAGQFPENPYNGPGYPAVLALATTLTGDLFTSGKWISMVSAIVVGLAAFLLFERLFGYWVGIGAELIIFASNQFPQFSIVATTDMFFLMLCLVSLVLFTHERITPTTRVVSSAVITGLAYLTRYNGLFLFVACLLGIIVLDVFAQSLRNRLKLAALFAAIFLITVAPWFYLNHKHRGSPLYNTNYLNVATEFYPELANENLYQEGTRQLSQMFHSFGDVLMYDPRRMITHYPVNLYESAAHSITRDLVSPWVGWFAVAGFVLALIERRSRSVMFLLVSGAIYFLFLALTHWEARYYFFILVVYAGLSAYAVFRPLELARSRGWAKHRAFVLVPIGLFLLMWFTSFASSKKDMQKFLSRHPTEVPAACEYFKSADISGAHIMVRKPHLAYICGQQWVYTPPVNSLDELRQWIEANPVDFIAIGEIEISRRPALAELKDPQAAPPWLKAVWVNPKPLLVLYQPNLSSHGAGLSGQ